MLVSKYIRQGKKTFKFVSTSGGTYGCNIKYWYGYFDKNIFNGLYYYFERYTEFEDDPDEKDGIGGMVPVDESLTILGSFKDDKKHGLCIIFKNRYSFTPASYSFYDMDNPITIDEFIKKSEKYINSDNLIEYRYLNNLLICDGDTVVSMMHINENNIPSLIINFNKQGELIKYGYFKGEEEDKFTYDNWETMEVDPITEDGYSVYREMDFFNDCSCRKHTREGLFKNGELNGLGLDYYNSYVNGYHYFIEQIGLFKDGKLYFGYTNDFENTGGKHSDAYFGYIDKREVSGEMILYDGKKYIGETTNNIPNGIGCLYEGDTKMYKGMFKNGKLHGICATYKLINDKWVPYDYVKDCIDKNYYWNSLCIYQEGEYKQGITFEKFYESENVLKI